MNVVRKLIGLVLIVFFGLPILFGMIWAVGLIKGTISPEFLTDLPRKIITEVPAEADEIFRDAASEEYITDANTRAWFQAAAKTGTTPSQLMAKAGLLDWMSGELSESLRQAGRMLRGEVRPRPLDIDLKPLKQAIQSPEVTGYLEATLNNLPSCDEQGLKNWEDVAMHRSEHRPLPACRPDPESMKTGIAAVQATAISDIPDNIQIFQGAHHLPVMPLGLSRSITMLSFLLFLIPAAFIFLGAVIADSTPSGFLKWSGASIFIGGLPALLLALAVKYFSLWGLASGGFSWHGQRTSELADLVIDKLRGIPEAIINQLFSPVILVGALVCAAGVVLFALSYSVRKTPRAASRPASPAQPAPSGRGTAPQGPGAPPVGPTA